MRAGTRWPASPSWPSWPAAPRRSRGNSPQVQPLAYSSDVAVVTSTVVLCGHRTSYASCSWSQTRRSFRPLAARRALSAGILPLAGPYVPEMTEAAQRKASNYSGFVFDFNKGSVSLVSVCSVHRSAQIARSPPPPPTQLTSTVAFAPSLPCRRFRLILHVAFAVHGAADGTIPRCSSFVLTIAVRLRAENRWRHAGRPARVQPGRAGPLPDVAAPARQRPDPRDHGCAAVLIVVISVTLHDTARDGHLVWTTMLDATARHEDITHDLLFVSLIDPSPRQPSTK